MNIVDVKIKDLKPYKKNPRRNKEAIDKVALSIEEFGFKVPIVIDCNNEIVTGHTRLEAAKKLGLKEVPCIIADDLSEEQVKAFRLVDNKVGEFSIWDDDLLSGELTDLEDLFDMSLFGFEPISWDEDEQEDEEDEEEKEHHSVVGEKQVNLQYYDDRRIEGLYNMPKVPAIDYIPSDLLSFNYAKTSKEYDKTIHFYIDDYQFTRVWNNIERYIPILQKFDAVCGPEFSAFKDMPNAMILWNIYRSRLVSQVLADWDLKVIPCVQWTTHRELWDAMYDGLPERSTLIVSCQSQLNGESERKIFIEAMNFLKEKKNPTRLLIYGSKTIDLELGDTEIIHYKNNVLERVREEAKNK